MRTAFIKQLIIDARRDERVFLIVGDLGFSVVEPFASEFKDRFLNVGVAEQNMTGIAAGLAKEGYTVFTYSIGNFPTLRCLEQIRYDVCYHNLNVKIVAVGGGYAYGPLGTSHHTTEDIGMLRTIPNMTICAPGDPIETRQITSLLSERIGPCYLRLGKAGEPTVHADATRLLFGKFAKVISGRDIAILSTGAMLKYSCDFITKNNLNWGLFSFPFIKPMDLEGLKNICTSYNKLITIEEHQKCGGFGSAILEGLNELDNENKIDNLPKVRVIAIADEFTTISGSQDYLRDLMGLKCDFAN